MNNTNTTTSPNPFQMGTVNVGGTNPNVVPGTNYASVASTLTPSQNENLMAFNQKMVTPAAPANIPQSQSIATFGTQPINLPASNISQPTPVPNLADSIVQQSFVPETQAQKMDKSLAQTIFDIAPKLQGETQDKYNAVQAATSDIQQKINDISSQIYQKNAEIQKDDIQLAADLDRLEGGGILKSIVNTQQYDIGKKAQITRSLKMADANMLNAQALALNGRLDFARQMATDAVNAKYSVYRDILETAKMQREALQPILSADEKKQAREQDIRTNLALKEVNKAEKNEESVMQMVVQAGAQGAPQSLVDKARLAKTPAEAVSILGAYAGDYWGTKIKIAQYGKLLNENAKIASEISANGLGTDSTVGAADQAKFLLDTIAKAKVKADAAGRSAGRRAAESWLVGSTDYTNLESQVRTLKTNLLTLATDPNIKKFFGPQMTENDVKNMQSAATTLDPELQNPQDLRAELVRAEAIFQKFAPDYKPAPVNVETWASGLGSVLNAANNNNYGYVDNQ